MSNQGKYCECKELAKKVRTHCLKMVHRGKSGHIGSMLSMADILALLYKRILKVDPKNPKMPERDRLLLSKGHGGAALFATLAELGFFPKDWLETYYLDNGKLSGHISHHVPGVEFSTGSLGHGLPVATGMAMASKRGGKPYRYFCIVSDGDCNAGSTWEAIMLAGQHGFDNLCMIVDYNQLQALGKSEDVINLDPFAEKLRLFNWSVKEINGHEMAELETALSKFPDGSGKPMAVIAHTVKGKGVSFMENDYKWHYGGLTDELLAKALKEVEAAI
ncbi:MAG: transketolase [Lentisphaerae bacterium GWF2_52_8]|nr:MAG: transketolase [Lentisphaerae bacterium GWF2_52_8]